MAGTLTVPLDHHTFLKTKIYTKICYRLRRDSTLCWSGCRTSRSSFERWATPSYTSSARREITSRHSTGRQLEIGGKLDSWEIGNTHTKLHEFSQKRDNFKTQYR